MSGPVSSATSAPMRYAATPIAGVASAGGKPGSTTRADANHQKGNEAADRNRRALPRCDLTMSSLSAVMATSHAAPHRTTRRLVGDQNDKTSSAPGTTKPGTTNQKRLAASVSTPPSYVATVMLHNGLGDLAVNVPHNAGAAALFAWTLLRPIDDPVHDLVERWVVAVVGPHRQERELEVVLHPSTDDLPPRALDVALDRRVP